MSGRTQKRFLSDAGDERSVTELAKSLYKIPVLLTTRTRCGKTHCRCRTGHLHGPYHALQWREGTTQRRRYVRTAEVPGIRAILQQRRCQRHQERLALAASLQSWRALACLTAEVEAHLRDEEARR